MAERSREKVREVRWWRCGKGMGKARGGMRGELGEREGEERERQRKEEAVAGRSREKVRKVRQRCYSERNQMPLKEVEEEGEEEKAVAGRNWEMVKEVRQWKRCGKGVEMAPAMWGWQLQLEQEGGEGEKMEERVVEKRRTLPAREEG